MKMGHFETLGSPGHKRSLRSLLSSFPWALIGAQDKDGTKEPLSGAVCIMCGHQGWVNGLWLSTDREALLLRGKE